MPITPNPPKFYQIEDIPRPRDMADYLDRVRAVRDMLPALPGTPEVPGDMNHLTYGAANDIELVLLQAERGIKSMVKSWVYSGEFESGGI